jgi:DNA-binding NtrC family response regulator
MKASVLIVDDEEALRTVLGDRFRFWGHDVDVARDGTEALRTAASKRFDLVILDLNLPDMPGLDVLDRLVAAECEADIVVLTAYGSVAGAVDGMRRGATDYLTKPADLELLQKVVERSLERRQLKRANKALRDQLSSPIKGPSAVMRRLYDEVERVAAYDSTVLLTGESGSGKQVIAESIHGLSRRKNGPFVYVNCVAISDDLIESTLFGHEKGAFTGAVQRKSGRLELAAGGTAFLDEIGDISPALQAKLLHFLESGQFETVGGTQTITVDCRLVAATNRNLEEEVANGRFREDLYYRLNVIALRIPPLRERVEDIEVLAREFLREFVAEFKREELSLDPRTLEIMRRYPWPGNVRQLRNAVERMAVMSRESVLGPSLLPPEVVEGPSLDSVDIGSLGYKEALIEAKRQIVRRALRTSGGNQTHASELLGIQRSYLNRLMKELNIDA